MSNENPTEPREVFDENEASIAQKKQEITDAVAAGEYDKVAELAQEAKAMETAGNEMKEDAHGEALEMNTGIDEAKAAEEKAAREVALAEQAKLDAEKSQQEAAALLEKMKSDNTTETGAENEEDPERALEIAEAEFKEVAKELKEVSQKVSKLVTEEWEKFQSNHTERFSIADYSPELSELAKKSDELSADYHKKENKARSLRVRLNSQ